MQTVTSRTRFRADVRSFEYRHFNPDLSLRASGTATTYMSLSNIKDNVNRRSGGVYHPSDLFHEKHSVRFGPPISSYTESFGTVFVQQPYTAYAPEYPSALWPVVPDSVISDFAYDSFKAFATQMPESVDLPNFVFEGRAILDLLPKIERSLRKTIAGGYLNLEFGWKPLLSDLEALSGLLTSVRAKIKYLKSIRGKNVRLGNYAGNVISIPFIRFYVPTGPYESRLLQYRCDLRAGGRLFHLLEDLDGFDAEIRGAIVALGLTNPLKSFWESTPFSFFFDWFSSLGRRLFDVSAQPFHGVYDVHDCSLSIKERAVVHSRWNYLSNLKDVGTVTMDRYTRFGHLPTKLSSFNLDQLTPKQQVLFTAILHSAGR